jgi:uncharacterized membrane protein
MTSQPQTSKTFNVLLWIAQALLSLSMLSGAVMKFMPIETISAMMPWTGQISPILVRLLGIIDLLGGLGLILPALLNYKPQLVVWASSGIIVLMICAIVFHVSRGEAPVIGFNIFCVLLGGFIAWGRWKNSCKKNRGVDSFTG